MRFDISYTMAFEYPAPVWESQNEIRVRPLDDSRQRVLSYRLTTKPAGRVLSFNDFWGTSVDHVGVRHRHDRFEIVAEAAVETFARPNDGESDRAENTSGLSPASPRLVDYVQATAHTAWNDEIVAMAQRHAPATLDRRERILAISDLVHRTIEYRSGSTEIGISPPELLAQGSGVCQDFAHLALAMMRGLGIPARYVSGYLFAADETDLSETSDAAVSVQTHAWIEAARDDTLWLPVDPTNSTPVGERHVVIGRGRDYDDVAPVRGVFTGPAAPHVTAQVTIARLSPLVRTVTSDLARPGPRVVAHDVAQWQQQQ